MGNFLGVGFKGAIGISLFTIVLIILLKVALTKYPVKGVTDLVNSI